MRPIRLSFALLLAACGSTKDAVPPAESLTPPPAPATSATVPTDISNSPADIATAAFAPTLNIVIGEFTRSGTGLYWKDHKVGDGKEAHIGSRVRVKYDGRLPNGTGFDNGVFPFVIGMHQVIDGWDQGIAGMKVGGTRTLIVPPSLGYGSEANGPIPANATLVFDVELLEVQ